MNPNDIELFKNWQLPLPTRNQHGIDSREMPISQQLIKLRPTNWRLRGNQLIADTDFGLLVNYIDPTYILTGIDTQGLPILTKIKM